MRLISIAEATPGLVVGRTVFDALGQPLLKGGVVLTHALIDRVRERGCRSLYAKADDGLPGVVLEGAGLPGALRTRARAALQGVFEQVSSLARGLREAPIQDKVRICRSQAMREITAQAGIVGAVRDAAEALSLDAAVYTRLTGVPEPRDAEWAAHDHAIDVCFAALVLGKTLDLPPLRMRQLAAGTLLHDVGTLFVSEQADETRRLQEHTVLGFELLRNCDDPDILAPTVALEHHERQDGQGVPRGLVGSNTLERQRAGTRPVPTLLGEIAALANAYDRLLHPLQGTPALSDMAVARLREGMGTAFNREVASAFLKVLPPYPVGFAVRVLDAPYEDYRGVVETLEDEFLDRPIVQLTHAPAGPLLEPIRLDLGLQPRIQIACIEEQF